MFRSHYIFRKAQIFKFVANFYKWKEPTKKWTHFPAVKPSPASCIPQALPCQLYTTAANKST